MTTILPNPGELLGQTSTTFEIQFPIQNPGTGEWAMYVHGEYKTLAEAKADAEECFVGRRYVILQRFNKVLADKVGTRPRPKKKAA
jgi:hypothetical protein